MSTEPQRWVGNKTGKKRLKEELLAHLGEGGVWPKVHAEKKRKKGRG